MNRLFSILLYTVALGIFATWALLPTSWTIHRPSLPDDMFQLDTITILAPLIQTALFYASAVTAVTLLILALLAKQWPVVRFSTIALLLAIVAFPFAGLLHITSNLASWTTHGRVLDAAGKSYVFCDSSFLQGQIMALTRVDVENEFFTRFKILGTNNGDWPESWASVVRPVNPTNDYGQLYLTQSNMLVGIRHNNKCYLAYDLNKDIFLGHGDVEHISPFICLNASDELHLADVTAIEKTISESTPGTAGYPYRESLESELKNANPHVRQVAENLLTKFYSHP